MLLSGKVAITMGCIQCEAFVTKRGKLDVPLLLFSVVDCSILHSEKRSLQNNSGFRDVHLKFDNPRALLIDSYAREPGCAVRDVVLTTSE